MKIMLQDDPTRTYRRNRKKLSQNKKFYLKPRLGSVAALGGRLHPIPSPVTMLPKTPDIPQGPIVRGPSAKNHHHACGRAGKDAIWS